MYQKIVLNLPSLTVLMLKMFIVQRLELAKCIANPACAANVACLQTCNNRPDETECQVFLCIIRMFGASSFLWIILISCVFFLVYFHF